MASVISNFFHKISSVRVGISQQNEDKEVFDQLNKWENNLMKIQKIITWDDPFLSCGCIISVNVLFWLIIYLDFKFYGIIFTAILILSLEQFWMENISPMLYQNESNFQMSSPTSSPTIPSNSRSLTPAEISCGIKKGQETVWNAFSKAKDFRRTQPGMFCLLTCFSFLILNVIGRSLSDILSFYILLMLTMTVPGALIHFLPPYVISSFSNFIYSSRKENDNDFEDEVEPYLPETNQEALELLRLAGDLQLPKTEDDEDSNDLLLEHISSRTSDTAESICSKSSFCPESTLMPSPENSMDFLEFDLPSGRAEPESESHDINFQNKHFDGESSDEEEFIRGLSLPGKDIKVNKKEDTQQTDKNSTTILSNTENLISTGTALLTSVIQQRNEGESSSDTDSFEMISEEDT